MSAGRPAKFNTVEELDTVIQEYFDQCVSEPIKDNQGFAIVTKQGQPVYDLNPPTITGLALALGFESRQSIYDYESKPEFSYSIKKARLTCEHFAEKYGMTGQIPPAISIFILKNYGWRDKTEVETTDKTDYAEQQRKIDQYKKQFENDEL